MSSFVDEGYSIKHDKKICMDFLSLSEQNLNIQYTIYNDLRSFKVEICVK